MKLQPVTTTNAPAAIGPYSQAIKAGNLMFASGQIPLKPDGQLAEGGINEQTHQVLRNVQAILKEAGAAFSDVAKTTVFLKDMNLFGQMNEIYSQYFGDHRPARSTIEVARLPRDVLVEIEVVAVLPDNN